MPSQKEHSPSTQKEHSTSSKKEKESSRGGSKERYSRIESKERSSHQNTEENIISEKIGIRKNSLDKNEKNEKSEKIVTLVI